MSFSKRLSELGVHLLPWCGGMQRRWDVLRPPQGICGWACAQALPLIRHSLHKPLNFSLPLCAFFIHLSGFRCRFCSTCFLPRGQAAVREWPLCHGWVVPSVRALSPSPWQTPATITVFRGLLGGRRDVAVVSYYPTLTSIKLDLATDSLGFE